MPAFVQSASAAVSGTTVGKAFTSPNAVGNCLIATVGVFSSGTGFLTPIITDSQGNTWIKLLSAPALFLSGIGCAYLFVAYNCKAGANTVTATINASVALSFSILEYSGVATVNARDQISAGAQGFITTVGTGSITTQHANEVILSFCYDQSGNHPLTPTSGWTQRETIGASRNLTTWDQIVSSTGTFSNTITVGSSSNGLFAIIVSLADVPTTDLFVQSIANTSQSSPVSVAFPKANVAGNVLFAAIGRKSAGSLGSISSVTDTRGNVWTQLASSPSVSDSGQSQAHLYICASCSAGVNTVTVATSPSEVISIAILEYAPRGTSVATGVSTSSAQSVASGNLSAASGALALSVAFNQSNGASIFSDFSGIGWKQRENETSTDATFGNFGSELSVFDQVLPSSQIIEQTVSVVPSTHGLHLIVDLSIPVPPPPPPATPCLPVDGNGNLTGGTYIRDLSLFILPETALYTNPILPGAITTSELNNEGRRTIILDFNNGDGLYARDLGTVFEWPTNNGLQVLVWQPSIIPMPEATYSRATDWDDAGSSGAKFIQGVIVEAFSFGIPKTFFLQDSDTLALHSLNECPATFAKQTEIAFSCAPFIAHSARLISSDGVEWRIWKSRIIAQPFPELTMNWQTELTSLGMTGWAHVREMNLAYSSTAPVTLTLSFDSITPIVITLPSTSGAQAKTKITVPPNKWKLIGFQASSATAFRIFQGDIELKLREWGAQGPYGMIKPFGGESNTGATV